MAGMNPLGTEEKRMYLGVFFKGYIINSHSESVQLHSSVSVVFRFRMLES